MMYRGARAARKMLRFVHVCIYIDAGEPVRSAHGIHKLTITFIAIMLWTRRQERKVKDTALSQAGRGILWISLYPDIHTPNLLTLSLHVLECSFRRTSNTNGV